MRNHFSREGGRELRLAGEGKDVRCGVDPGQEGKGPPEPGWKVHFVETIGDRGEIFKGSKGRIPHGTAVKGLSGAEPYESGWSCLEGSKQNL